MKQGISGPAGRLAALHASLCLGLCRNSDELRPLNGTQLTTNWAGERPARHHIPQQGGDMHSRFLLFSAAAVELPASCAGACLTTNFAHFGRGARTRESTIINRVRSIGGAGGAPTGGAVRFLRPSLLPSTARSMMAGWVFLVLMGACQLPIRARCGRVCD